MGCPSSKQKDTDPKINYKPNIQITGDEVSFLPTPAIKVIFIFGMFQFVTASMNVRVIEVHVHAFHFMVY